ncbi:hypothetical protein ONZ51_g3165 [Trametes cubensis]|uniref:Uncharacterized protein n=1 Tax=Trametes cubensis TaxID=1111947 RepID=A0AAD7XE70_9APHY|nr:hypothetical protein ONZ51_g3165 [Trametes cubensis]
MVAALDDSEALRQAEAMKPKLYLVYLQWVCSALPPPYEKQILIPSEELALPFPEQPWYRFEIEPIAASLRQEDKARGISVDMCIPIFPNTSHPNGREPVKPQPEGLFPYDNCYHWFAAKTVDVRIRARPEGFNETNAASLDVRSEMQIMHYWNEDGPRLRTNKQNSETESDTMALVTRSSREVDVASTTGYGTPMGIGGADVSKPHHREQQDTVGPGDTELVSASSEVAPIQDNQSAHSLDDIDAIDIFSGPNEDTDLVPLVDLWISELSDYLKQEDIPSPLEMFDEFNEIAQVVRQARIRSYAALTAPALDMSNADTHSVSDDIVIEKRRLSEHISH